MAGSFISLTAGRLLFAAVAMLCGAQATASTFSADPYPSTYRPLPRHDTLIKGATILDGAGARLDGGDILVRDGRIVAVGKTLPAPDGVDVIEASGRWVTPGIIDVHSHNGTFSMPLTTIDNEASDVSETSDPNSADIWVEHGINMQDPSFSRALASGVTTQQILPGSVPVFGGRSVVVKTIPANIVSAIKFPGAPQGLKIACGENPKSHYGEKGMFPTSRMGEILAMRRGFLAARKYASAWKDYRSGKSKTAPERDLKQETLAAVLDGDIKLHVHCYRADDMATIIALSDELGFRITAFHHATEAYKIVPLLREKDICVAVWSDWWGFKMETLDAIRPNAAFVDAGGGCAIMHSDSPQVGQRLNIEAAKVIGAAHQVGIDIPPERAIRWLTSNPARALGLEDRIGTLRPGRNADLVIWSGDPFSIYSHADQVMVDGAIAFDRSDPKRQPVSDFELGRKPATGEH